MPKTFYLFLLIATLLVSSNAMAQSRSATFTVEIVPTADLDMTTNNGYCRPWLESMFVSKRSNRSTYSAMLFDLSALPKGAVITAANLQLYGVNTNSHDARVYAVPSFDPSTPFNCITVDGLVGPVAWALPTTSGAYIDSPDLTSLMATADGGTIGLILTAGEAETGGGKGFRTLEWEGGAYAPRLVVEYQIGVGR